MVKRTSSVAVVVALYHPRRHGSAMTTIDELNRQRAERHRLIDAEYDGTVWWLNVKSQCWNRLQWNANLMPGKWSHWLPTGLTRPAAPGGE